MTLPLTFALLLALPDTADVWPVTVSGWFTLIGVIVGVGGSIIGSFITYGKFLAKLNGFGDRVGVVEKEQAAGKERDATLSAAMERMTFAQDNLLVHIGEAKASAGKCSEDMEQYTREIGSEIHALGKAIQNEARAAGERLKAVETTLMHLTRERDRDDRYRRTDP